MKYEACTSSWHADWTEVPKFKTLINPECTLWFNERGGYSLKMTQIGWARLGNVTCLTTLETIGRRVPSCTLAINPGSRKYKFVFRRSSLVIEKLWWLLALPSHLEEGFDCFAPWRVGMMSEDKNLSEFFRYFSRLWIWGHARRLSNVSCRSFFEESCIILRKEDTYF